MTRLRNAVTGTVVGLLPLAASADYLGTLRAPQSGFAPAGIYMLAVDAPPPALSRPDNPYRLRLGYQYSRYFAVEGEFVDFGARAADVFANPASLATGLRSTGFGVDTIAMLPLWGFSFYGRLGAYRGDARGGLGWHSTSLLPDPASRGARWRYGLGMRYDFTRSLGIRAELERHSPLHGSMAPEIEPADQLSVGLSWRF
jgi:hypothetical protein